MSHSLFALEKETEVVFTVIASWNKVLVASFISFLRGMDADIMIMNYTAYAGLEISAESAVALRT